MSKKWQNILIIVSLAVSIALILWVTLFSRFGSYSRHFYAPFSSYKAVINGSSRALLEIVGNVVLFIPIGVGSALFLGLNTKRSMLIGFTISLIIECCQWFFWLGSFEIDDLIHNTIGSGIGTILIYQTPLEQKLKIRDKKKGLSLFITLIASIIVTIYGCQSLKWYEMYKLARQNDREDGTKNLLVLHSEPKYLVDSDFNVLYNEDGSVLIEGSTERRSWIEIGWVTLSPGLYSFSGLTDVEENTIYLELHYYDSKQDKYIELTQRIGVLERDYFEINETKHLRCVVGLYPNTIGEYVCRPVIYREN